MLVPPVKVPVEGKLWFDPSHNYRWNVMAPPTFIVAEAKAH